MNAGQNKSSIAEELLARSRPAEAAAELHLDKVVRKPLYLRPTDEEESVKDINGLDARARRQKARREKQLAARKSSKLKPKPLSAKERRKLCVYDIPKEQQKYELYLPLHALWQGYMREVLGLSGEGPHGNYVSIKNAGPMITSADLHGAIVQVVRCKSVGRVGIQGIVLKDTKFAFEVITPKNELKSKSECDFIEIHAIELHILTRLAAVPKGDTIFRIEIQLPPRKLEQAEQPTVDTTVELPSEDNDRANLVFELHGSSFENRPADRATKKVRLHIPPDL